MNSRIFSWIPGAQVPPISHPSMFLLKPCHPQEPPGMLDTNWNGILMTHLPLPFWWSGIRVPVPIKATAIPEWSIRKHRFTRYHPLEDNFLISDSLPNLEDLSIKFQHLANVVKITRKPLTLYWEETSTGPAIEGSKTCKIICSTMKT